MRMLIFTVLAGTLFSVQGYGQGADTTSSKREKNRFATEWYVAKGGIGVITSEHLYLDLKSAKNELRLMDGRSWTGKVAGTREVVMFFEDRIWSPPDLPSGFDLSKAGVISFEGDIVRFFEFASLSGGYYNRIPRE